LNDLDHTDSKKEALTKNKMAISAFTMAFRKAPNCTALIDESKKEHCWPSGKLHEIIEELLDEFAPEDLMENIQ